MLLDFSLGLHSVHENAFVLVMLDTKHIHWHYHWIVLRTVGFPDFVLFVQHEANMGNKLKNPLGSANNLINLSYCLRHHFEPYFERHISHI